MAASTPADRIECAQIGANSRWADPAQREARAIEARQALISRFDPGPDVPEPMRSKILMNNLKAHSLRMNRAKRAKAEARRREAAAKLAGELAETEAS